MSLFFFLKNFESSSLCGKKNNYKKAFNSFFK